MKCLLLAVSPLNFKSYALKIKNTEGEICIRKSIK